MNSITIDRIMSFHPCGWTGPNDGMNYTRERVTELFAGRETIITAEILDMPISAADRIWAWARVIDRAIIVEFACCCWNRAAAPVWDAMYPNDDRPQKCVDATRAFMREEISANELKKAAVAAWKAREKMTDSAKKSDAAWVAWIAADIALDFQIDTILTKAARTLSAAWTAVLAKTVWSKDRGVKEDILKAWDEIIVIARELS
jgi:hypothetical protein